MRLTALILSALPLALAAPTAFAHAGDHGTLASLAAALQHLLSQPDHLALLALAVGVVVVAVSRRHPARRKIARGQDRSGAEQ